MNEILERSRNKKSGRKNLDHEGSTPSGSVSSGTTSQAPLMSKLSRASTLPTAESSLSPAMESPEEEEDAWITLEEEELEYCRSSGVVSEESEDPSCGIQEQALVLYKKPSSFPEAVDIWCRSATALMQSKEMAVFICSSRDVAFCAGNWAVKTALLPVSIPFGIASSVTQSIVGSCANVIYTTGDFVENTLRLQCTSSGESTRQASDGLRNGFVSFVFGLPGIAVGFVEKIKDEAGSVVVKVVAPVLGISENGNDGSSGVPAQHRHGTPKKVTRSGQSSAESENFLDRLRIDVIAEPDSPQCSVAAVEAVVVSNEVNPAQDEDEPVQRVLFELDRSETSKYLLRVDDLGLSSTIDDDPDVFTTNPSGLVFYADLDPSRSEAEKRLSRMALDRLVTCGLALFTNHPTARLSKRYEPTPLSAVEWKVEGSTGRLLRKIAKLSTLERLEAMQQDTLIWSGRFQQARGYGRQHPLFLARGIVRRSPREMLELLWDNTRTTEYNNFCLGRSNLLVIEDKVMSEAGTGTKVVRSETRVPFTSLSVVLSCLMHARPLESPDEGFLIVSRSTDCGVAGTHVGSNKHVEKSSASTSEILLGVNVLRRVPNHPYLTDLTSLSQVGAKVPGFLASKIACMGVEDFFKNVRQRKGC